MKRRLNLVCLMLFTLIASNAIAFSRIGVEPSGNLQNDGIRTTDYTAWNLPKLGRAERLRFCRMRLGKLTQPLSATTHTEQGLTAINAISRLSVKTVLSPQ